MVDSQEFCILGIRNSHDNVQKQNGLNLFFWYISYKQVPSRQDFIALVLPPPLPIVSKSSCTLKSV